MQQYNNNNNKDSASQNSSSSQHKNNKKNKIKLRIEDVTIENEYYIDIAKKFKIAKYIILILLIFYVLAMISLYRDEITVENFRYMIKYLDNSSSDYDGEYSTIYYNSDTQSSHAYYKGELAVAGKAGLSLFSMTGISDLNVTLGYTEPKLIAASRYLMAYDFFGNSYSLYNSFSQLYSQSTEYPISNAALSDSGVYAIVTKTQEYRSVVLFYDKDFELISQILKEKYVMDISLMPDGNNALIVSAYNSAGMYSCEIMTIDPHTDEPFAVMTFDDRLPLVAAFNSSGGYTVVCDTGVMIFDSSNELLKYNDFGGYEPSRCEIGDYYTAVALSRNVVVNENRIIFFDTKGKIVYDEIIKGEILDIKTDMNYAYIVFDGRIKKINILTGVCGEYAINKNCTEILVVSDTVLLVCYDNRSVAIENTDAAFGMNIVDTAESEQKEANSETIKATSP